ncbi:hypothetical protein [Mycobacterium sp. 155]|uniref:hypothetical protein n=1 Tax=Mycobacterium sp. 155 TaxID=1157943 RepID=UPI000399B9DE|nr:hypothetical protein [Mycobacterium sp. 155]
MSKTVADPDGAVTDEWWAHGHLKDEDSPLELLGPVPPMPPAECGGGADTGPVAPTAAVPADDDPLGVDTSDPVVAQQPPVELDTPTAPGPAATAAGEADPNAGARKVAVWLGTGLVVALTAIVAAVVMFTDHSRSAPPPREPAQSAVMPVTPAPAPTSMPPAPDSDQVVPYTAAANCPPGSTSAQSLADASTDSAWVCVRGQQGAQVDGQVLHVDFGHSYVLSAASVTPGWVPKTPGGKDDWLQHRVVTKLQYIFNDGDRTVVTQDTGNVHGPVIMALPKRVLASQVTVIVLQTARPPATPPAGTADPGGDQPGFGDSVLGSGGTPPTSDTATATDPATLDAPGTDPVDATFAISALKFFGHQPN